jgi:signal transduction histidine kinase
VSLRARFLALFAAFAVVPLIAVGVFDYVHSMRALETLVAEQVEPIVDRSVTELRDRFVVSESNLQLLSQNVETERLYRAHATGAGEQIAEARAALEPFMREAWEVFESSMAWVEFRDSVGAVLYRVPDAWEAGGPAIKEAASPIVPSLMPVTRPIRVGQREVGSLRAGIILEDILPQEALETRFGRAGYSVVVDRERRAVVYHPRHSYRNQPLDVLTGPGGWNVDPAVLEQSEGRIVYREADTTRVAAFLSLDEPPWTVLASGATTEFEAPFTRMRLINLSMVLAVALLVTVAFILLSRRETRSLTALTAAADQVGMGNFEPDLPQAGSGEVGQLTAAFGLMVDKVRTMIRQVESSRHMAAIGEFSARVSHEIRNPLTSLKLNLQGLERDVESGHIPADCARPVEICLREIKRLDEVASGVLSLGRPRPLEPEPCSVHELLEGAVDVVSAQLTEQGVTVERFFAADRDIADVDREAVKAAFLNLFLNAAEAMREGGTLRISTRIAATRDRIAIAVADDGPGITPEAREQVFEPFVSTKSQGTGLGLPLARRTFQEHGGTLVLAAPAVGAEFVIDLPLSNQDTPA